MLSDKTKQYYAELYEDSLNKCKVETIKDFALNLKEKVITKHGWSDAVEVEDIDSVVKEMIDEMS